MYIYMYIFVLITFKFQFRLLVQLMDKIRFKIALKLRIFRSEQEGWMTIWPICAYCKTLYFCAPVDEDEIAKLQVS